MSLTKLLPIPDKWKKDNAIVYKVYETDPLPERTLHSPIWAPSNEHFIGQSYRCHGKYLIWLAGDGNGEYPTGWHSPVSLDGAKKWLRYLAKWTHDPRDNFTIVKVAIKEPVAYGTDEAGSRVIVFKYKTLIEEMPQCRTTLIKMVCQGSKSTGKINQFPGVA